ncbi:Apple domain-containing protein [Forsythia ovata]|uniref:Apple domain-containing protein n=1 Tax=Forsythia ovata TaxID=205694 RepID=A0ABD1WMT2_9LAMI
MAVLYYPILTRGYFGQLRRTETVLVGIRFYRVIRQVQPQYRSKSNILKHKPLEAKAAVVKGQGPIRVVLTSDGYLGMFQTGSTPVDVQSFNSFQQNVFGIFRVRIEPDGNLKGYSTVLGHHLTPKKQRPTTACHNIRHPFETHFSPLRTIVFHPKDNGA